MYEYVHKNTNLNSYKCFDVQEILYNRMLKFAYQHAFCD